MVTLHDWPRTMTSTWLVQVFSCTEMHQKLKLDRMKRQIQKLIPRDVGSLLNWWKSLLCLVHLFMVPRFFFYFGLDPFINIVIHRILSALVCCLFFINSMDISQNLCFQVAFPLRSSLLLLADEVLNL